MIIFLLDSVEHIVGKGDNAGCQHFLLFPQCFQKVSSSGMLKVKKKQDCVGKPHIPTFNDPER